MTRRWIGALFAGAAIMVAACGGSTPSTAPATQAPASQGTASEAPATEAPASQDAGAPTPGGTLVVGLEGDINRTDAAIVDDLNSSYVLQQAVEGLVTLAAGTGDEIVPALATEWSVSDDALTYTFKIREGVKFHDGTDLNAEAVKWNFDRWLNIPQSYIDLSYTYYIDSVIGRGDKSFVESVTVVDDSTVDVKLRNPNSAFLLQLTLTPFAIQSPTAIEAGGGNDPDFANNKYATGVAPTMVGTGPFMFKEWVNGDHVTLEKNPNYWNASAGGPYLDAITFRSLPETTARLNALTAGDIDLAQNIAPVDLPTVEGDPELAVIDRGSACNLGTIGMNQSFKPFDNLKIRQAVAAAIDRQGIVDAFFGPAGTVVDNWTPPGSPFEKELAFPAYDPEAAKALIAESGVAPADLAFDFWYPSDVTRAYMPDPKGEAEAILGMLEAVGFQPNPQTDPWDPTYLAKWTAGDYPMFLAGWNCDWFGIDNFLYTAFFGYQGGQPNPTYDWRNDEANQAMLDALAATDEATQQTNWEKAQDLILADMPSVPIGSLKSPGGISTKVQGFAASPTQTEFFTNVWLGQ